MAHPSMVRLGGAILLILLLAVLLAEGASQRLRRSSAKTRSSPSVTTKISIALKHASALVLWIVRNAKLFVRPLLRHHRHLHLDVDGATHPLLPQRDCNKPGAVCQDPRFVGGDGITFYFHGKRDQDFCLVSDSNIHINAHFIGKRDQNMRRDFTWVQSLGILFDNRKLFIGAKPTSTWDDSVDRLAIVIDDQTISLPDNEGAYWQSQGLKITRSKNTNAVEIEAEGNFKIKAVVVPITEKESVIHKYGITQEDCFAHLDLSFKFYALSGEVNGVLGQTYSENYVSRVKMGVVMPVLGGDREFSSSSIFASDCSVARFSGEFSEKSKYASTMNCASGMDGRGVVCKR